MAALGALLIGWLVSRLEQSMTYHPTPPAGMQPVQFGMPYEHVRLKTDDGETLQAWWISRPEAGAPVLLFFHGNAGNREDRLHNLAGLWQAGISVLIFDYRGYGGSTGTPSETGLIADGLAAFDWLAQKAGGRPITLFGRSLGGAVAAAVALRLQAEAPTRPAGGLILESTFTSAREMAGRVLPFPGIHLIVRASYDSLTAVGELRMPLLMIHGTADDLVPFEMGLRIFAAAASPAKRFHQVPGGRHNDTYVVAGDAYYRWLREFLAEVGTVSGD